MNLKIQVSVPVCGNEEERRWSRSCVWWALFQLYYTPDHLETFVGLSYDQKVDPIKHSGLKPDNIVDTLSEYVPEGESVFAEREEQVFWAFAHWCHMHPRFLYQQG